MLSSKSTLPREEREEKRRRKVHNRSSSQVRCHHLSRLHFGPLPNPINFHSTVIITVDPFVKLPLPLAHRRSSSSSGSSSIASISSSSILLPMPNQAREVVCVTRRRLQTRGLLLGRAGEDGAHERACRAGRAGGAGERGGEEGLAEVVELFGLLAWSSRE